MVREAVVGHEGTSVLLATWRRELAEAVRPVVTGADSVVLLDFPEYANVGDSALWLGALELLRVLGFPSPAYVAGPSTYMPEVLRSRVGTRPVLFLLGGGNVGDVWPDRQAFREQVLLDFPDYRVVQLPQSVRFGSQPSLDRARRIMGEHPDFTFFARTSRDQERATSQLGIPARLAPDLSSALPPMARPVAADRDVLWLSRDDREAPGRHRVDGMVERLDWPADPSSHLFWMLRWASNYPRRVWRVLPGGFTGLLEQIARYRLRLGLRLLARGRVIVTNRLHGHLLALALGIPHFISDNSYGKLRAYYDTWTYRSELTRWCASEDEAITAAMECLAPGAEGPS